ncbi:hypothetical protein KQX54_010970 [Cotesia glomerata]|uniref:Uncharacterized protein n=1 Tax=Cotesia glomerata TaxID=32391 RepID=A0AAV7J8D6_COTGL|nr:hypothetical protein KQX54_010970 [Cotesia glomerata]
MIDGSTEGHLSSISCCGDIGLRDGFDLLGKYHLRLDINIHIPSRGMRKFGHSSTLAISPRGILEFSGLRSSSSSSGRTRRVLPLVDVDVNMGGSNNVSGVDYAVSGQEQPSAQLGPPMMQGPPVAASSGHILAF